MRRLLSVTRFMFAVLLLTLVFCLGACGAGEREESKEDDMDDLDSHELINDGVDQVLEDYLDEDGYLEPDTDVVEEAALAVYDYALKLEEAGTIEGAAYCEAGHSVSFFNNDGTTTVYLPPIRDFCSGAGEFSVALMDFFTLSRLESKLKSPSYREPEDTILDAMDNVIVSTYSNDKTIDELKEFFGSLDEENVRAIFWRGHGGMYRNCKGEDIFCFCINEKVTEKKLDKFKKSGDLGSEDWSSEKLVEVCDDGRKFAFTHYFIDKYMCNVSGGLFFASTCESFSDGGIMANSFFNKGFDSYVGTSDVIKILYAGDVMSRTVEYLTRQDEYGAYIDINSALGQAVEDFNGSINQKLNYYDGGGNFVLMNRDDSKPFRFRVPAGIEVKLKSSDGSVEPGEVSVQCLKLNPDGSTFPYERLDNGEVSEEGFFIPRDDTGKGVMYEVNIYYKSELIMSVTIDPEELDFRSGAASTTIDMSVRYLDIIVTDGAGDFLPDADVEVVATDAKNDLLGLLRRAELTTNEDGERVYRLLVTPGEYYVEVTDDTYGSTEGEVVVEGDTTVTFPLGVDVHEKLHEYLLRVLVSEYPTPTRPGLEDIDLYDSSIWGTPRTGGTYSVYYGDVDGDGQEELCAFRTKYIPEEFAIGVYVDIFEYRNGEVVLAAEKSFGSMSGDSDVVAVRLSKIYNAVELSSFIYKYEGKTYFMLERWMRTDHNEREIWLCSYDGKKFVDDTFDYNCWYDSGENGETNTPGISAYGLSSMLERYQAYDDYSIKPIDVEPAYTFYGDEGPLYPMFGFVLWNRDPDNIGLFSIDRYDYTYHLENFMITDG